MKTKIQRETTHNGSMMILKNIPTTRYTRRTFSFPISITFKTMTRWRKLKNRNIGCTFLGCMSTPKLLRITSFGILGIIQPVQKFSAQLTLT